MVAQPLDHSSLHSVLESRRNNFSENASVRMTSGPESSGLFLHLPPPCGMVSERSLLFAASFLLLGQCRTRVQRALVKSEAKTTRPHFATPFLRNVQLHAHLLNSGMAKHCHRPGAIPGTEIVPDSFFCTGK